MVQHPEEAPLCMDSQGPGGGAGKDNPGMEQHPDEASLCAGDQGAGGVAKDDPGPGLYVTYKARDQVPG